MISIKDRKILGQIFSHYDYVMTTAQLSKEKLYYRDVQRMLEAGLIERIKRGYYHWAAGSGKGDVVIISRLFPDGILCMETLSKMLSYSDFSMSEIGTKRTAVFIIMQDEKSTYHPLVSAFIKQCYEVLIGTAQEYGGALPIRTNFVLDEFANLPPITDMSNMITAARSRNIRLNLIIQGAEQLNAQYGKETAEVIKGNCTNWFFLISKELQLLKDISELCGITEEQIGINEFRERPLVSISQLQRLKIGEILIRRDREHPFRANLPDISEYSYWDCTEHNSGEENKAREDVCIFDIQEFVKKSKKEEVQFNVDELVARLDKKIAELEKEEKEEKEKAENEKMEKMNMLKG